MDMRLAEIQEAFHVHPRARQWQPRRMGARKRKPLGGGGGHRGTSPDGLDWKKRMCLDNTTTMAAPPDVRGLGEKSTFGWASLLDVRGPAAPEYKESTRLQEPVFAVGSEAFVF